RAVHLRFGRVGADAARHAALLGSGLPGRREPGGDEEGDAQGGAGQTGGGSRVHRGSTGGTGGVRGPAGTPSPALLRLRDGRSLVSASRPAPLAGGVGEERPVRAPMRAEAGPGRNGATRIPCRRYRALPRTRAP